MAENQVLRERVQLLRQELHQVCRDLQHLSNGSHGEYASRRL